MNIANLVAGWWTLGAGALLIAVVIAFLWSTAESLVDLSLLLAGKKVPILKTSSTWYLGIENMSGSIITEATRIASTTISEGIQALSQDAQKLVSEMSEHLTQEAQNYTTEQINEIYEEGIQIGATRGDEIENTLTVALDDLLSNYNKKEEIQFDKTLYMVPGTRGYSLLSKMENQVFRGLENQVVTYNTLVATKTSVMENLRSDMDTLKENMIKESNVVIESQMEKFEKNLLNQIEILEEKGEKVTKDYILKSTQGLRKNIIKGFEDNGYVTDTVNKGQRLSELIPSGSYQDYLRLFMLMDQKDSEQRMLRMLDVIEINIGAQKNMPDFKLSNFVVGIEGTSIYKIKYAFFNVPFLQTLRSDEPSKLYSIKSKVQNRYD
jgi:hypothetical protein